MSRFLNHSACDRCGSSDAKANYDNETAYCFSCSTWFGPRNGERAQSSVSGLITEGLEYKELRKRGITQQTCEKFRYASRPGEQIAQYFDQKGQLVAQKIRDPDKDFRWVGEAKRAGLFGMQLWAAGGKRIVITEGEIDALSASQVQGNSWPVVSLSRGAAGAKKELLQHLEYLESFGEVVLMFDQDDPGRKAAAECAEIFTPGKAKIAQLPLKDANEMLQAGKTRELVSAIWQAKAYRPDGLVEGSDLWSEVVAEPVRGLSYPWQCLDRVLYGMRPRELVCWTGGTGTGKSQFLKELGYHLVTYHKERVGIISLEESVRTAALGQMSLAANRRLHLPPVRAEASEAELKGWFDVTFGTGLYLFSDPKHVTPDQLLPKIRYMVLGAGVQWVLLDHISMSIGAEATSGDERKRIDELMYRLRNLVDELGFGLHFVTHLRKKEGKPHEEGGRVSLVDFRGSGAIAQVANIAIGVERNQQAQDEDRNRTTLRVLKNRFAGETAVAGEVLFDQETGRLSEVPMAAMRQAETRTEERGDF